MTAQEVKARGIRKAKQYTISGIKMGRFDDDLDRLLRAVQRRRADIGQIKVIRVGPGGVLIPEESPEEKRASELDEGERRDQWPMNDDKLPTNVQDVLSKIHTNLDSDSPAQPPLTKHSYSRHNSVSVDDNYISKYELQGRIVTMTDDAAEQSGVAVAYVVSVARRNLTIYPLLACGSATTRKYQAIMRSGRIGKQFTVSPDHVADCYTDVDVLKRVVETGASGIFSA